MKIIKEIFLNSIFCLSRYQQVTAVNLGSWKNIRTFRYLAEKNSVGPSVLNYKADSQKKSGVLNLH